MNPNAIRRKRRLLPILLVALVATPAASTPPAQEGASAPGTKAGRVLPPPEPGPQRRDGRAEDLLKAAIKAHGGPEGLTARQTIFIKSKITNYDFPEPESGTITTWFKRPMKIRREIAYPRRKTIHVYDGERAWVDDGTGPRMLGPLFARMMERGILELDMPLLYTEGSLSYLNISKDPRGRVVQRISWRDQGYARDLMIDVATNRILAIGEFDTPAGAIARMRIFDDYRLVQGVMMSFHQEVLRNDRRYSETELIEAKFNEPIDEDLFRYKGPSPPPAP